MSEEFSMNDQLESWERAKERAKQEGRYIKHPVFGDIIGYASVKEFDDAMSKWSNEHNQHPLSPKGN